MNFLKKAISILFFIIMVYIIILLFGFDNLNYYGKQDHLLNNAWALIFIFVSFFIFYIFNKKKQIDNKKYWVFIIFISIGTFLIQYIIVKFGLFYSGWDARAIRDISENVYYNNLISNPTYLTMYPNNIFLTFILVLIKSIPFIGKKYLTTLAINALLVNVAGIFTSLTLKNITKNNFLAILVYLISIPLILLSPWILIPYSDTFAILFPICILFIYTKDHKKLYDYFMIGFLSIIGYFIKPTVIIVFIAIVIIEIITKISTINISNAKQYFKPVVSLLIGILIAYSMRYISIWYINFKPDKNVEEFNWTHFLAMGENEETNGIYSDDDVYHSMKYGMKDNIDIFIKRISTRSFTGQIEFFSKKTLINFNGPAFAWGIEGSFYYNVPPSVGKMNDVIRSVYYGDGKYYKYFMLLEQWIWLLVIFFCPFIIQENSKNKLVVMLSLVGIILFLTIFEPRTRYLYCFSPIFVVCSMIGMSSLKDKIKLLKNRKKQFK